MAVYCSHCGTKLEDFMTFCYNCGNPPKGAAKSTTTRTPKVEYKEVILNKDQLRGVKAEDPLGLNRQGAANAAQSRILELLKPYFGQGWQIDGTIMSAVQFKWIDPYFGLNYTLKEAKVRLIRTT